jgi:thioredoxin 1
MKKKQIVQISTVLGILLLVAGVWLLKNYETKSTPTTATSTEAAVAAIAEPAIPSAAPEDGTITPSQSATPTAVETNEDFVLEAESINLEQLLMNQLPIIIDFGSDSCIPCKEMAPVLQAMNAEMRGKAIIKFVDVWKHPRGASTFPIQVIPTQVIYRADGSPYVPSDAAKQSGLTFTLYQRKTTGEHVMTLHQGGLTEADMRLILGELGVPQ